MIAQSRGYHNKSCVLCVALVGCHTLAATVCNKQCQNVYFFVLYALNVNLQSK